MAWADAGREVPTVPAQRTTPTVTRNERRRHAFIGLSSTDVGKGAVPLFGALFERVRGNQVVGHDASFHEVLADDPLEDGRVASLVPRAFRVDDGNRSAL